MGRGRTGKELAGNTGNRGVKFFTQALLRAIRLFVGVLLIASVFLICANAAGRYLFLAPIIWAEEILGYVLVWTVYLGAALVTWDGGHLRMDLISRSMPGLLRYLVNGLAVASFLAVGGIIIYQSFEAIAAFTHLSQVAEVPMQLMHIVIPLSFVIILLFILLRLRAHLNDTLAEADGETMKGDAT
jgi:TRAP-type C4-dicarboxylate transport system permease small subunit